VKYASDGTSTGKKICYPYANVYAGLIVIAITFSLIITLLFRVRDRVSAGRRGYQMVEPSTGNNCAENLRKEFIRPDGQTVVTLNNVNVTIKAGEFVSLIGPSAAEINVFKAAGRAFETDEGKFTLDGVPITAPGYERGLVFRTHPVPWLTVYDNIAFGIKIRNIYHEKKTGYRTSSV
jgi:ABC-type polysaccharide/polyol phosphate transport system ATPase subunit